MLSKEIEKEVIQHLKRIKLLLFLGKGETETESIVSVVDRMPNLEKDIITRKYLHCESEYTRHQMIYKDMNISDHSYRKIRLRGLYKIALVLSLVDVKWMKPVIQTIESPVQIRDYLQVEALLSKHDEDQLSKFLYEAGLYITIGKEVEGLTELHQAIMKLDPIEEKIITRKYLSRDANYITNQQVQNELFLFANPYIKYRSSALAKLAAELGIVSVGKEKEE